jgi:hypothetical protein
MIQLIRRALRPVPFGTSAQADQMIFDPQCTLAEWRDAMKFLAASR